MGLNYSAESNSINILTNLYFLNRNSLFDVIKEIFINVFSTVIQ